MSDKTRIGEAAGDSAHTHPPRRTAMMNTGIGDTAESTHPMGMKRIPRPELHENSSMRNGPGRQPLTRIPDGHRAAAIAAVAKSGTRTASDATGIATETASASGTATGTGGSQATARIVIRTTSARSETAIERRIVTAIVIGIRTATEIGTVKTGEKIVATVTATGIRTATGNTGTAVARRQMMKAHLSRSR